MSTTSIVCVVCICVWDVSQTIKPIGSCELPLRPPSGISNHVQKSPRTPYNIPQKHHLTLILTLTQTPKLTLNQTLIRRFWEGLSGHPEYTGQKRYRFILHKIVVLFIKRNIKI